MALNNEQSPYRIVSYKKAPKWQIRKHDRYRIYMIGCVYLIIKIYEKVGVLDV